MWERGEIFPIFSSVKDEGCGKRKNIPHVFHQWRMRDVERGKMFPFFIREGWGMWEGGKYCPLLVIQGRMRDVGREKVFPIFIHPRKGKGCGKEKISPIFIHPRKGCGIWEGGKYLFFIRKGWEMWEGKKFRRGGWVKLKMKEEKSEWMGGVEKG
jgi:hypothetical protein